MLRRAERTRDKIDHPHHERFVVNMNLTHGRSEQTAPTALRSAAADTHMNHPGWRRALRRELTWLMTLKVAALVLLWWLFFSPPHHSAVDGEAASRRFAVTPSAVVTPTSHPAGREHRRD
jgi:hypothetical protein